MKNTEQKNRARDRLRRNRSFRTLTPQEDNRINELLKICLQKVCELQTELQRGEDTHMDPEAAGYAACATEALRFLSAEGLPPNHPMVRRLTERLLRRNSE